MLPSCVSSFWFLLCVFPSLQCFSVPSLPCLFLASLHLFLIPSLVCRYIVFVLPYVFLSLFCLPPSSSVLACITSVMPPCVHLQCLVVPNVGMFLIFVPWNFINLYLGFVALCFWSLWIILGFSSSLNFCILSLVLLKLAFSPYSCLPHVSTFGSSSCSTITYKRHSTSSSYPVWE